MRLTGRQRAWPAAIGIDQRMKVNPPRDRSIDCFLFRVMHAPC